MFSEIAEATEANFSKDVKLKKKKTTNNMKMNISVLKASFGCSLIYKNIWFGRLPFLIEHTRNFSIYKGR